MNAESHAQASGWDLCQETEASEAGVLAVSAAGVDIGDAGCGYLHGSLREESDCLRGRSF